MKPKGLLTCGFASLSFPPIPLVSPPIVAPMWPHPSPILVITRSHAVEGRVPAGDRYKDTKGLHAVPFTGRNSGDFRSAETFNDRARALFEQHHDQIGVFRSLLGLTEMEVALGDLERARVALGRADALLNGLASDHERAQLCFKAAQVEGLSGDYEQAHALVEQGLGLCRKLGVPRRQWVNELINIGWFALQQEDFARATAALEEYLAEDSGTTPRGVANAHANLGWATLHEEDPEDAALRFQEALALAREAGAKRTIATAAYGLAAVAAMHDNFERSARLWDAADAIRRSTSSPLSTQEQFIIERYLKSARATLAEDPNGAALAEAGSMRLDEALAYSLEQLNSAPDLVRKLNEY